MLSVPAESRAPSRCCLFGRAEQQRATSLESPGATRLGGTGSSKRPHPLQCNLGGFSSFPAQFQPPRLLGTTRLAQRHGGQGGAVRYPGALERQPRTRGYQHALGLSMSQVSPALDAAATSSAGHAPPVALCLTGKHASPPSTPLPTPPSLGSHWESLVFSLARQASPGGYGWVPAVARVWRLHFTPRICKAAHLAPT